MTPTAQCMLYICRPARLPVHLLSSRLPTLSGLALADKRKCLRKWMWKRHLGSSVMAVMPLCQLCHEKRNALLVLLFQQTFSFIHIIHLINGLALSKRWNMRFIDNHHQSCCTLSFLFRWTQHVHALETSITAHDKMFLLLFESCNLPLKWMTNGIITTHSNL